MRKLSAFLFGLTASCIAISGLGKITSVAEETNSSLDHSIVYIGGMPAGFSLSTGGAQVIGLCEIINDDGVMSPAKDAKIRIGDLIYNAAGIEIKTISDLNEIINKNGAKTLELLVLREDTKLKIKVNPILDKVTGRYKIGVLIRDSVSGIGTITYIDKNTGKFGSLGHSVMGDNKEELYISSGVVYNCSIVGVTKGVRGRAGELRGLFLNETPFGKAEKISEFGIYGTVDENYNLTSLPTVEVSSVENAQIGEAFIYSTISGVYPKKYSVQIVKVDKKNKGNKNYVVKITDKALIEETGGIVQGMSGSPIIQNGKMIGAITHVFLNDPTRGYGIDITTMRKDDIK